MPQYNDTYTQVLTDYAQAAFLNPDEEVSVGRLLFPMVGVKASTGIFDIYDRRAALTPVDTRLARDNSAYRLQLEKVLGTYNCEANGLEIAQWDPQMDQDMANEYRENCLKLLMSAQFVSREASAVAKVKAAVAAESGLGGWTSSGSDVIADLNALLVKVSQGAARKPSGILMSRDAWLVAANHPSVTGRLNGNSALSYDTGSFSALLGMDVPITVVDTYLMQGGTMTPLLSNDVIAYFNEDAASRSDMSFGKEFSTSPNGPTVSTWKEHGVRNVDTLYWSSDRHITNAAALARLVVS